MLLLIEQVNGQDAVVLELRDPLGAMMSADIKVEDVPADQDFPRSPLVPNPQSPNPPNRLPTSRIPSPKRCK
jgi:hypothetical protein